MSAMQLSGYGWTGRILKVDLSTGKITKETYDKKIAEEFVGGDGLGTYLLFKNTSPGIEPLSPQNVFILSTGPLTGTLFPSSGRLSAVFKSPHTGLIGCSNAGGFFAPELKWAGYDALMVTGRSEKPVWIWIDNDQVEIRDAGHLWGKDTFDTIDTIHHELKDESVSTVTIGPAGEKQVVYALALVNRGRALGKGGAGAVMGSKNLKAIAVRGSKGVRVADPEKFQEICWKFRNQLLTSPHYAPWATYGFPLFYAALEEHQNVLPTYNFQAGLFPEGRKSLSIGQMVEQIVEKQNEGCYGCPVQCSHILHIKDGKYKGVRIEGLEFYAQYVFGPNIGCTDWNFVVKCHEQSNRLGVQYTVGAIIAWVAELYQRKIVTKEQLDGIEPTWGNEEAFLELIRKIANREGIGDILAQGWDKASDYFGKESKKYTCVINRMDSTEDIRGRLEVALSHLVANRGGDHNKAMPSWHWVTPPEYTQQKYPDLPKEAIDMYNPIGKVEMVDISETSHAVIDALGSCLVVSFQIFGSEGADLELYAEALTAMTGTQYDAKKLAECGKRIVVLERAFNVREGWGRELYDASPKWFEQPLQEGVQKGWVLDRKLANEMIDAFLVKRGFDPKTNFPIKAKLEELDLGFAADALEKMGRLSKESKKESKA